MNWLWRRIREWWFTEELSQLEEDLYWCIERTRHGFTGLDPEKPEDMVISNRICSELIKLRVTKQRIVTLIGDDGWGELWKRYSIGDNLIYYEAVI